MGFWRRGWGSVDCCLLLVELFGHVTLKMFGIGDGEGETEAMWCLLGAATFVALVESSANWAKDKE